ncbi:SWIM zinc finger family protein [Streptomyces sp. 549]|uniref:SWIM zinc finger family protein n=1 Tax=Streptomyces sp. 549 TaxID=3049076 RepID=UPI0024C2A2A9|nr:SWIM zinc finger family protein [Streptomyces sp. 549]MDK1472788.1 SWIM zinc finger family protein [Streptomyces sp. 549]
MTGDQVRWTAEQVLALAPDAASRKAGGKLSGPAPWSGTGTGGGAVWGLCKGSGSTPYRTVVDVDDPAYKCSCPSRKFPCKHALGLLLLWAAGPQAVAPGTEPPPEWAGTWITGRRTRPPQGAARPATAAPADPAAARRRTERRLARITAGATELEERLNDLLRGGIAGADRAGYGAWDETAARMVDAQAPGLAGRIRELAAIPASGAGWPGRLLEECALLHLLDQGFLGLDGLPEPLAATVRAQVGLTVDTAGLLADREALLRDEWLVVGRSDTDEGRLAVRRLWLHGTRSARFALLLSFGPAGRSPETALPVGSTLDAELAFYPGAEQVRAALGERHGSSPAGPVPPGTDVGTALAAYGAVLASDPWADDRPTVLSGVVPVPDGAEGRWQLADADGTAALPLVCDARSALWRLAAVSGGGPVTVFGTCGHRGFVPHTVWSGSQAVAL